MTGDEMGLFFDFKNKASVDEDLFNKCNNSFMRSFFLKNVYVSSEIKVTVKKEIKTCPKNSIVNETTYLE